MQTFDRRIIRVVRTPPRRHAWFWFHEPRYRKCIVRIEQRIARGMAEYMEGFIFHLPDPPLYPFTPIRTGSALDAPSAN